MALAPLVQERVARAGRGAGVVDFVFLARAGDRPRPAGRRPIDRDEVRPAILAAAARRLRRLRWTAEALREATVAMAEAAGRSWGRRRPRSEWR